MFRSLLMAATAATLAACGPRYASKGPLQPEDLQTPLPAKHVVVDGIDIAYVDSGGDKPPMVLIHGLSSYMGFWEYQVPAFADDYRVLALDLPGYGASGKPDAPYTPPWYADTIAAWMEKVGVDGPAVVTGHSMGGQIAVHLALRYPEKVDRLVLSAPAGFERFSPGAARYMRTYWHETRAMEASEEHVRANFMTMVFNRHDEGVERLIEERVRLGQSPSFGGTAVAVSRSIAGMLDHLVIDRAREVRAPTLIVYGTDDKMIPNPVFNGGATRDIARQASAAIPGSRLVMLPGAGHTVHHDAPQAFNRAVEEFLR